MFERLDKLRNDLIKAKKKQADAEQKVRNLEVRLKEAENTQVLANVNALNLSPEQVAEFLKLVQSGGLLGLPKDIKKSVGMITSEEIDTVDNQESTYSYNNVSITESTMRDSFEKEEVKDED